MHVQEFRGWVRRVHETYHKPQPALPTFPHKKSIAGTTTVVVARGGETGSVRRLCLRARSLRSRSAGGSGVVWVDTRVCTRRHTNSHVERTSEGFSAATSSAAGMAAAFEAVERRRVVAAAAVRAMTPPPSLIIWLSFSRRGREAASKFRFGGSPVPFIGKESRI